ncbi:hypothetical protein TD95_004846 [Thielaviopsis punctulata]|uniref:DUF1917 domain-containing protein n=1 Tax=Thielaviopsis punctulata TaxID=72032 RepID=A0A0F4ZCN9_9PEZI|nr:hypothetical protein TD95_004846 [Thielaviopsis punctulata]
MDGDESDFYGDDDTTSALEHRVSVFNPTQWWKATLTAPPPLMTIKPPTDSPVPDTSICDDQQNPMEGLPFAWQVGETAASFAARLPPSSTIETESVPCIYVCNPHMNLTVRHADWQSRQSRGNEYEGPEVKGALFKTAHDGALERLNILHRFLMGLEKVRKPQSFKTLEANAEKATAIKNIMHLSHTCRMHSGKWMLVIDRKLIDQVWKSIVQATLNNTLGVAAKVQPANNPDKGPPRKEHLISVYTRDYTDTGDVKRVLLRLKELNLLTARPIYYKPDIFTYVGIAYNNKYDIRASLYSSKDFALKG